MKNIVKTQIALFAFGVILLGLCILTFISCSTNDQNAHGIAETSPTGAVTEPTKAVEATEEPTATPTLSPSLSPSPTPGTVVVFVEYAWWLDRIREPYAIVKVHSVDDELIPLFVNGHGVDCVRAECEILFSHRADSLVTSEYVEGARLADSFDEINEMYFVSSVADDILNAEAVLVSLEHSISYDEYGRPDLFLAVAVDTETLPKLRLITADGLDMSGPYGYDRVLEELNEVVRTYAELYAEIEKKSEFVRAIPERQLETGMSIEEIKQWFYGWEKCLELHERDTEKAKEPTREP